MLCELMLIRVTVVTLNALKSTAYELSMSRKLNDNSMHELGTVCFAYIQSQTKLNPRSAEGIFIGYSHSSPA